jgi:hypothetical protein
MQVFYLSATAFFVCRHIHRYPLTLLGLSPVFLPEKHNYGTVTIVSEVVLWRGRRRRTEEAIRPSAHTRKQEEEEGIQGKDRRTKAAPKVGSAGKQ